jgi:hypothetical protein
LVRPVLRCVGKAGYDRKNIKIDQRHCKYGYEY